MMKTEEFLCILTQKGWKWKNNAIVSNEEDYLFTMCSVARLSLKGKNKHFFLKEINYSLLY